ncbi:MAG: immunity 51 family protein [Ruminococcus sp.]|jgi:hypothetical protein|nr:immunity 51 family protein [Ruminococcus sp.]
MDYTPFFLSEYGDTYSICLNCDGEYRTEFFDEFEDKGFCGGNGSDFEAVAIVFVEEQMPDLEIDYDSEAGMFCAMFGSKEDAEKFAVAYKAAIENDDVFRALLKKAEVY